VYSLSVDSKTVRLNIGSNSIKSLPFTNNDPKHYLSRLHELGYSWLLSLFTWREAPFKITSNKSGSAAIGARKIASNRNWWKSLVVQKSRWSGRNSVKVSLSFKEAALCVAVSNGRTWRQRRCLLHKLVTNCGTCRTSRPIIASTATYVRAA